MRPGQGRNTRGQFTGGQGRNTRGQFTGVDTLLRRLNDLGKSVVHASIQGVREEAEAIMADSAPLVPFDLGILLGSHVVGEPVVMRGNIECHFGYGGAAKDYAVVQHENLHFVHPRGQAKYLEQPFMARVATWLPRLASRIRELTGIR